MDEENKNQADGRDKPEGNSPAADELQKCRKERDEYLAGWQRAKADFINYKKEELRRLQEVARYGSEELMRELITVMDNFDLGLRALERSGGVDKGMYMIKSQREDG